MNATKPHDFSQPAAVNLAGKYLTFRLGGDEYGVEIMKVQEIVGMMPVTQVPKVPAFVRGIVNLRGRIVPTIDLRAKFGMPGVETTGKTCIIVVEVASGTGKLSLGLIVDEVADVLHINTGAADHVSHFAGNIRMDYVLGVGLVNDAMKILLDIDKVMSFEEVRAVQARASTPKAS